MHLEGDMLKQFYFGKYIWKLLPYQNEGYYWKNMEKVYGRQPECVIMYNCVLSISGG